MMNMKLKLLTFIFFAALYLMGIPLSALASVMQENIKVSGVITDATGGQPMVGVSVSLKDATAGTISDMDGRYNLEVPRGGILVFSYLGYLPREEKITQAVLNVTLEEDVKLLNEVVVVGYGVQKKASVIGAISTVGTRDLVQSPAANLGNALSGRLPGLTTVQLSGMPGADEPDLYIRGMATWENSDPLFIVDGIERETITNIDANEIETVSILKDASATAVYGVKGANGVIIVTTKKGVHDKPVVNFSSKWGFQTPTRIPPFLRSYNTAFLKNEAILNDDPSILSRSRENIIIALKQNGGFSPEDLDAFQNKTNSPYYDPYYYPDVDWWAEMVKKTTPQQQYNVNVRGGSNLARYFVSAGYLSQDGFFKTTGTHKNFNFNRFNFRSNLDLDVTKDVTFSINLAARIENRTEPGNEWNTRGDAFYAINRIAPYETAVINPDGRAGYGVNNLNAWSMINKVGYKLFRSDILESNFTFNYNLNRFVKGLSLKAQFSYDSYYYDQKTYQESAMRSKLISLPGMPYEYEYMGTDSPLNYLPNLSPTSANEKTYVDASVYYDRSFNKVHNVTALLLYNQSDARSGGSIPYRYSGLVSRVTYNYDLRYFGEFNMGYNGSENFAPGKRFGFFPSFSLGWLISEEPFMKSHSNLISLLKIRGSYGLVGNDRLSGSGNYRFLYLQNFNRQAPTWGGAVQAKFGADASARPFIFESTASNPDVTWEKAVKSNIGVEVSLWKDKFSFTGDLFYERRDNILMALTTIPAYFGVSAPPDNVGAVQNKGFELEVTHRNEISKDWKYFIKGNLGFATNKIISRDEPSNLLSWQKEEGRRIGQFQGYIVEKFFESQEEIDNSPEQLVGKAPQPGDFKYKNLNDDKIIDDRDRTYIGFSQVPELTYGFSLGFDYKYFDASILFQGATRSSLYIGGDLLYEFPLGQGKLLEHHLNRWAYYTDPFTGEQIDTRATATYPRLHNGSSPNANVNSFFLMDNSYLKIRNVELGYSFRRNFLKKAGISQLRIYAAGSNLFCWTKVKQVDPEGGGNENYPQMSVYSFGMNITF
jgi:TonB-linked SusC/RagA family outer membrane protein